MFAEIHDYYEKVKQEIEASAKAELDKLSGDVAELETDVQAAIKDAKAQALEDIKTAAPDVQAAVQTALSKLEQAVLAVIANKLA